MFLDNYGTSNANPCHQGTHVHRRYVAARRASNDQIETATRERKTDISGQQYIWYIFLTNYSARHLPNWDGAYNGMC